MIKEKIKKRQKPILFAWIALWIITVFYGVHRWEASFIGCLVFLFPFLIILITLPIFLLDIGFEGARRKKKKKDADHDAGAEWVKKGQKIAKTGLKRSVFDLDLDIE
jgi:hypothetical protein